VIVKVCVAVVAILATGNMALSPLLAALLIVGGVVLAAGACIIIAGIVRLAGAHPASLLPRDDPTPTRR
jgi:hypothetical protein